MARRARAREVRGADSFEDRVDNRVGEMRSNGTFLFSLLFRRCEHARLDRTSQHRFGAGEMRSNGTFLFSNLLLGCEHARLTRTSQHRFGAGVFLVSAKKGAIIYPGDFFQRHGNVESHSVRGGIMRYSMFSPWVCYAMPGF